MPSSFKRSFSEAASDADDECEQPISKKRFATVYDAVTGKAGNDGSIDRNSRSRIHHKPSEPLRPDEVLFKQRNAPTRYEESDYYFAHARLRHDQQLPDSDLLHALHAYVANFYRKSEGGLDPRIWRSMDETALIALGILVEETAREVLGETGDLAFLEADEESLEESRSDVSEASGDEEKDSTS